MEITIQKQIFESISKAHRILLPLPTFPTGDSLAAALALHGFLHRLDKDPKLVCLGAIPERYGFLPGVDQISTQLEQGRGFVISVRTTDAPLDELSYHRDESKEKVDIFLKPQSGQYRQEDVSFKSDRFPYDLIISLGVASLDLYGSLYEGNADLFFETPIVNIDHHSNNEHFGEINLVDITATATTEILSELLENFETNLVEGPIATNLLAGILIETNSFQHIKTTPKSFLRASSLISQGADQQGIIKYLYKTKSVGLLKLWGRALARLRQVPELGLSYSLLRQEDIAKTGSGVAEILSVAEELVASLSDSKLIAVLYEEALGRISGLVYIHPTLSSLEIGSLLGVEQSHGNIFTFRPSAATLTEAEAELLARLARVKPK
ncbi:MAG: hypothetical protein HY397_00110 [Candidatus Doudnabacteria bacterium]|nr:hypothetical protein [Candidatus Doudnabacteria bacterium]